MRRPDLALFDQDTERRHHARRWALILGAAALLLLAAIIWFATRAGDLLPADGSTTATVTVSSSTSSQPDRDAMDAAAAAAITAYEQRRSTVCDLVEPWVARGLESNEKLCSTGAADTGSSPVQVTITRLDSVTCDQGTGAYVADLGRPTSFAQRYVTVGLQKENATWLVTGWGTSASIDPAKALARTCTSPRYEGPAPTS